MRLVLLVLLSLLSACATTPPAPAPQARWLVGSWLVAEDGTRDRTACASGLPIRYSADGTYALFEEAGTWALDQDRLTEIATAASGTVDPAEVAIGRPYVSHVERRGQDEFVKTFAGGEQLLFLRCGAE